MTGFNISNGSTTVKNSPEHSPRCVDVSTHVCGRDVEAGAQHWPAKEADAKSPARDAYITFTVNALESDYEVPKDEEGTYRRYSTQQITFFDVEDARALRDCLTAAIECADVK